MAKQKKINVQKIANKNPKVDAKKVAEALAAINQLGNVGVGRSEFNLVLPFTRRPTAPKQQGRWPAR